MTELFLKVNKDLFGMGLNPTEILIVAQVLEFQTKNLNCFISDDTFATALGVSKRTIQRTIEGLESKKIITRETKNTKKGKERFLYVRISAIEELTSGQNDCCENLSNGQNDTCANDNLSQPKRQNDTIKDNIRDKNIKDKTLSSSANAEEVELEDSFENWIP